MSSPFSISSLNEGGKSKNLDSRVCVCVCVGKKEARGEGGGEGFSNKRLINIH